MNRFLIAAGAAAVALASLPAIAAPETPKASSQDGLFVMDAAQGNMTEIATSRLVADRSKDADLAAFAKKVIEDHKALESKLADAASTADVTRPDELDKGHQMEVDMLKAASDADFAKLYLQIQDKEHRDAVYAFNTEAQFGMNAGIKQAATDGLPTILQHQLMVVQLENKMQVPAGTLPGAADGEKKPLSKG